MLLVLAALAHLAARWSLSAVPLYLGAGLLFGREGPLRLGGSIEFIEIAAEIGVVLLLFTLGLEYSARQLIDEFKVTLPSGAADFALNFTPGFVLGLLVGWGAVTATLLGGITYVSSSGIAARLIHDLRWSATQEGRKTIGVLVVEDLVMAGFLALVGVLVVGSGLVAALVALAAAAALVTAAIVVNLRFGERLSTWLFSHEGEKLLLGMVGLALVVAGAAETVSVSAAVGAFLAGIAVSGRASHAFHRQLDPLRAFFAAAFFVLFGLQAELDDLDSVIWLAVGLAVVTAATKIATGWVAGARIGSDAAGRFRIGALLVARGEFSIIIAELGVAAGLRRDLALLAVTYVIIMAALGPVAVRWAARFEAPSTP